MLNLSFSNKIKGVDLSNYILPDDIISKVINYNYNFDSGPEYRLQKVYEDEIWMKLDSLGINALEFKDKKILDICCGKGFLSYHLLAKIYPQSLTMVDISPFELTEAKKLIQYWYPDDKVNCIQADVLTSEIVDECYDIVIGNSFLHHFYNVPLAIKVLKRILRPGGLFITLHEPTVAAVAYESGHVWQLLRYLFKRQDYVDDIRYDGEDVSAGGGADVWIFEKEHVLKLLKLENFSDISFSDWHLFRPIIAAKMILHLDNTKQRLSRFEECALNAGIVADSKLKFFLPSTVFGSFCFVARKPDNGLGCYA